MKFRINFKTPDTMMDAIRQRLEEINFPDTGEGQQARDDLKSHMLEAAQNYISYGEATILEFDTDSNAVRAVPVRRPVQQSRAAVLEWIKDHPNWEQVDDSLVKSFKFSDFNAALGFVARIGALAERRDHHPVIELRWGKVKVSWTSDDAGGITTRDLYAASQCDLFYLSPQ